MKEINGRIYKRALYDLEKQMKERAERIEALRTERDAAVSRAAELEGLRLEWSTTPPTSDGFYWWHCDCEQPDTPLMVQVSCIDGKMHSMFLYGVFSVSFHECAECRWAGPIVQPEVQHGE